jgi:uncharacterized protein (TIGR02265 family)
LVGDVDFDAVISDCPPDFTVKGMFFARYVNALEGSWEKIAPTLDAPARHGRYHAFGDYPLRDLARLFDRVARERFPGSTREAYRLMARGEIEVFSQSTFGKVVFSLVREPSALLLRYPELYEAVAKGPRLHAEQLGPRRVVLRYERLFGSMEHALGLVEGLVLAFDESPTIDIQTGKGTEVAFDVSW